MDVKARPWMAEAEIEIMDSIFRTQRPKRVLEWGAGGSTLYWPQQYGFIEEWLSIEHDRAFANAVRKQAGERVTVRTATGKRYWNQRGEYDLIIVDGRWRVECLTAAVDLLAEGGVVVLHDSGRSAYNEAWKVWPHCEELYPGEKADGDYYRHRGLTVFWKGDVETGWLRQYQGEPLARPAYEPPEDVNDTTGLPGQAQEDVDDTTWGLIGE